MDQKYNLVHRADGRLLGWASVHLLPGEKEGTADLADINLVADDIKTEVKEPQEMGGTFESAITASSDKNLLAQEYSSQQEKAAFHGIQETTPNDISDMETESWPYPFQNVNVHNQLSVFATLNPGDIERLKKPSHHGFKRVCYSKFVNGVPASNSGRINSVYYLSPPDSLGSQQKIRTRSELRKVLTSFPDLTLQNFVMARKIYGLGPKFEEVKESRFYYWQEERQPDPGNDQLNSLWLYRDFFNLIDPGEGQGGMVACKLCPADDDGRLMVRNGVNSHMRNFHLPDEECSKCGREFRPTSKSIRQHNRVCGNQLTLPSSSTTTRNKREQKRRQVNCPICLKVVTNSNLRRHIRNVHPGDDLGKGDLMLKESESSTTEVADSNRGEMEVSVSSSHSSDRGVEKPLKQSLEETEVSNKTEVNDNEVQDKEKGVAFKPATTVRVAFEMDGMKTVKMETRVGLKMLKLIKKFGRRCASHHLNDLVFLQGERRLSGEEFVEDLTEKVVKVGRKT